MNTSIKHNYVQCNGARASNKNKDTRIKAHKSVKLALSAKKKKTHINSAISALVQTVTSISS